MTTNTYSISNMNCQGCVGHIKDKIESHPHITQVEVSLDKGEAVINMSEDISLAELQRHLDHDSEYAGRYVLSESVQPIEG